jgi:hypothetical protein
VKRGESDGKHHIDRILAWQMGQSVEYKKPNVKTNVSALAKKPRLEPHRESVGYPH